MKIKLENRSSFIDMPEGSSASDLAKELNLLAPSLALAARINGQTVDLAAKLSDGDSVLFLDFDSCEGQAVFWHTSAHVLAQAVLNLWPEAKPTIGPPIEDGFYYDFANLTISDKDFSQIEKEMKAIIKNNAPPKRVVLKKEEAFKEFASNKYKMEIIEALSDDEEISVYSFGEFSDLCRGPHLPSLKKIKALKIMKTSGAYWRGDSQNEMLTRIYAISFPDKTELKEYLFRLEEAKKRDHKILGPKLDLFSISEEAPGMPIIHPGGMRIWNKLIDFWRKKHFSKGYVEIKTPIIMKQSLWETSGHWEHYRENMYITKIDEQDFAIKPMNCPGCILYYKKKRHSYREFPLRIGEIGLVHRHEPSGALSGLFRVLSFHQDDAHIFVTPKGIKQEILNILHFADEIYSAFGLSYHLELSTRPEKGSIGTDEEWEQTTNGLKDALKAFGADFIINEGDGAFYGPKIDMHIKDSLGRTWQCGTIQLDMSLPLRFGLEYTAEDGSRKTPTLIHRVLYGSLERFFAHLIEHFSGKFPLWISPHPVTIVPVADRHVPYAKEVCQKIKRHNLFCEVDESNESVSKKIRNAEIKQINYMLTVGDKEEENKTVSVRLRDNVDVGTLEIEEFIQALVEENKNRLIKSPYLKEE